jgi:hypothetical protein|tara:strand:- start:5203 stop:5343 length:141 start_codon:yes stop_codon:yes gene_type:complete
MEQYSPPKITEKITIKKTQNSIIKTKKNKYLDNVLSKDFLKSYFKF